MSKSWDELVARVDTLERQSAGNLEVARDRSEWRQQVHHLRRAVELAAASTVTIRLGDILAAEPTMHRTTFTFGTYSTGGVAVDFEGLVPTFLDAIVPPKNGYTFEYDGADKLKAFSTADTEVTDALDVSTLIGEVAIYVLGSRQTSLPGYVSPGGETMVGGTFRCSGGMAADSTDFWTLELRVKRAARPNLAEQTFGETVSRRLTNAVGIEDGAALPLVPDGSRVTLEEGDTVLLYATASTDDTTGFGEAFFDIELESKVL